MPRPQPLPGTGPSGGSEAIGGTIGPEAAQTPQKISGKVHLWGANRDAKIEVLKAIGTNPIQFDVLKQFAQKGSRHRSLLASTLGSAMGGAKWTSDVGGTPTELSANAVTVFLRLTETGVLEHSDCQHVFAKLTDGKLPSGKSISTTPTCAFLSPQSPFWSAIKPLSRNQRTQLADSLSPLPREVYAQSREYLQLQSELDTLEQKFKEPFNYGGPLANLRRACLGLGVDLLKNGGKVTDLADSNGSAKDKKIIQEELEKPQVKAALAELQAFHAEHGERIQGLNRELNSLGKMLQPYVHEGHGHLMGVGVSIPESECTIRRDILAGKPRATFGDCWDTMTKGTDLISYAEWELTVKEAKQQRQALAEGRKEAIMEQPPDLKKYKKCAQATLNFIENYKGKLASYNRVFQLKIRHRIGDPPKESTPELSLPSEVVNNGFSYALQSALFGVLPEIKGKVNLAGSNDLSGMVKIFQKVLDHPDQYDLPADFQFPSELRELLTIAQEIAKVMG
jgi:hypothetical protein